jgi:hypothetical protein
MNDGPKETTKRSKLDLNVAEIKFVGQLPNGSLDLIYFAHNNTLDTATITHQIGENLSVVAGKMYLLTQGWESDYDPYDQYIFSLAGNLAPTQAENGAQINLIFGDHTFSAQALQGNHLLITSDNKEVTFENNGGLSTALQYRGVFYGGIKPIFTYSLVRTSSSKGSDGHNYGDGYQSQIGASVQLVYGNMFLDAEWLTVKKLKFKNEPSADNKDTDYSSLVFQAKSYTSHVTPIFKITLDQMKTGMNQSQIDSGAVGNLVGTQYAIGLERMLDKSCRLHAVYSVDSTSQKIAANKTKTVNKYQINLGVTASI